MGFVVARRRELKGIAADLLGFCCSRNFDVRGYWGMGILYQLTFNQGLRDLHLDVSPNFTKKDDGLDDYRRAFSQWVLSHMDRHGMQRSWLRQAYFSVSFETEEKRRLHQAFLRCGLPFICDVVLISDLGREYISTEGGYCYRHGNCPTTESRRRKEHWGKPLFVK